MTQLDRTLTSLRRALDHLETRAPALIERDERGGSPEKDGYPSGGGEGGSRSSDNTSSTERTAVARLEGHDRPDDVHRAAKALVQHLDTALKHLHSAESMVKLGEHLATHDGRHSNPPTDCLACGRTVNCTTEDPSRSGLCSSCSTAWYRYKATEEAEGRVADRSRFARTRRENPAA